MFDRLWLRNGYIVTVTRLLVASLFDKALHEFVVPWSLSYLLSWRGGSTGNNPRLIFLPQKFTFKLRPQEPKQRILHCESASRSFTPCVLASAYRAPKQWCLRELEAKSSLHIIIGQQLRLFQFKSVQWLKKTRTQPIRGLEADSDHISLA